MDANVTRRDALKALTVLGGGALAVGLAGCAQPSVPGEGSSALSETNGNASGSSVDWLGSAPEVTKDDCSETFESDVVVIGSAVAGSMAALAAQDEGAEVTVLEKWSSFHYGGFGAAFVNSQYQLDHGMPKYDPQEILTDINRCLCYRCDASLWAAWAFHSGEVLDWLYDKVLKDSGIVITCKAFGFEDRTTEISPFYDTVVEIGNPENGDNFREFVQTLHDYLDSNGVQFRFETPAVKLETDADGRVVGVIAQNKEGAYEYYGVRKGVVVCTGGFGHDEAMVDEFFSPRIARFLKEQNWYNGVMQADKTPEIPLDTGDGHKMLCWVGAQMEEKTHSYNSWPISPLCGVPMLMVNQAGHRFLNEATSFLNIAHVVAEQPGDSLAYWKIVDQAALDGELPSSFNAVLPKGAVDVETESVKADTLEELAEMIDVDPVVLNATVERYNELCAAGFDEDYGKLSKYMLPVATPPFHAVKETLVAAVTMGGVKCNGLMEVIDEMGNPIPGVYAAGNTMGRRFGWSYEASHIGLTNSLAIVHGYFAGKNCAS